MTVMTVLGISITQRIAARVATALTLTPWTRMRHVAGTSVRANFPDPGLPGGGRAVFVALHEAPGDIAAYLAMADEVNVAELSIGSPGWRWVLPRVEDDGTLTFRDRDVPRETHHWG